MIPQEVGKTNTPTDPNTALTNYADGQGGIRSAWDTKSMKYLYLLTKRDR